MQPIRSIGAREAATVAGNAATRILASPTARTGVLIHNAHQSHSLWIRLVDRGSSPPTLSASDRDYVIPPENTLNILASDTVEIYAQNSTGNSTTTPYTATEVKR
jgi:hypothetical protein